MKKCNQTVQSFGPLKQSYFYPCNCPAKHKMTVLEVRGEVESIVCGKHRNSLLAWCKRFKKITGKDPLISDVKI